MSEGSPPQQSLAHLPDASEELAALADLEITVDGCALPLHRVTLASGSRVLRTALCSCSSSVKGRAAARAAEAAAVQAAFEGFSLLDVQLFLKIVYHPLKGLELVLAETNWDGLVSLAVKLDATPVLEVGNFYFLSQTCMDWLSTAMLLDAGLLKNTLRIHSSGLRSLPGFNHSR
jgi:hypothetical protein